MKTLDMQNLKQPCVIRAIHGINSAQRRRLLDMGLTPETKVVVTRLAPLGEPMEVSLRGYSLIMRKEDAKLIEVA